MAHSKYGQLQQAARAHENSTVQASQLSKKSASSLPGLSDLHLNTGNPISVTLIAVVLHQFSSRATSSPSLSALVNVSHAVSNGKRHINLPITFRLPE